MYIQDPLYAKFIDQLCAAATGHLRTRSRLVSSSEDHGPRRRAVFLSSIMTLWKGFALSLEECLATVAHSFCHTPDLDVAA